MQTVRRPWMVFVIETGGRFEEEYGKLLTNNAGLTNLSTHVMLDVSVDNIHPVKSPYSNRLTLDIRGFLMNYLFCRCLKHF